MKVRQLMAGLLLGMVCGATLAANGAARTVQQLRLERDRAIKELEDAREELARMKEAGSQSGGPRVTDVEVTVEHPDPRVLLEVERRLEKQLKPLIGRPVQTLNPFSFYYDITGQHMEVDERVYRLRLLGVVVFPRLLLHVRVEEPPSGRPAAGGN